jgi:predicted butyrate kinase (DUF1464 family)
MTLRVAGSDPGTSSLDLLVLQDGVVADQTRLLPGELHADPAAAARWLQERAPFDLIAGPSGYGVPLLRAADCTQGDLDLMSLVRPDDVSAPGASATRRQHLIGLRAIQEALIAARLPVVFLPGVIHLPTVPSHRKLNRIDMGTPDKLCVVALACSMLAAAQQRTFCLVELGSAFTACLVVHDGQIVDGRGGTCGAFGWLSGGAWDGEAAYILSPLRKRDLFVGGAASLPDPTMAAARMRESLLQVVAGLQALSPFPVIVLSGRLLEAEPALVAAITADLSVLGSVVRLESLPGAWVKHAAQGAALVVDGLAGGKLAPLMEQLSLRGAAGTVLDWLHYR